MSKFKLASDFKPTGDQPQAIEKLAGGIKAGLRHQVLLGVTGSGKTFSVANVIGKIQQPTLVISHNKTLAAQLFQEFREFFPKNAVEYFVSYYDYYQPEAYIPQRDQYIAKEVEINELIDKLRLSTTASLMTRRDVIVVASVSCIYNLGSPVEYGRATLELKTQNVKLKSKYQISNLNTEGVLAQLVDLHYQRSDYDFKRATFRIRGSTVDIWPSYQDEALRLEFGVNGLEKIYKLDPVTGNKLGELEAAAIYPAKHFMTQKETYERALPAVRKDLGLQVKKLQKRGKALEAHRLKQRTEYDLELIEELGFCPGIENYSRYFDGRQPGQPPYTLLDYFPHLFLTIIDESHITVPQIRGMYEGDRARKETLVEYGFRLPSALDNRPLRFEEFLQRVGQTIYTSATPAEWEIKKAQNSNLKSQNYNLKLKTKKTLDFGGVVEQLIRPTGLLDPEIKIRKTEGQIDDLIMEIGKRVKRRERVLVTTLTKRMAEELATYLEEKGIKVHYLHADVETLKRTEILEDLRKGKYDVVVGINLLREGLDLPEVSLVAILDADKEGFLRSETSLIQVMGRAARHIRGKVIMYADNVTGSMRRAIAEVDRRRQVQLEYNRQHKIKPQSIVKPIRERLVNEEPATQKHRILRDTEAQIEAMPPVEKQRLIDDLELKMTEAARDLDFEQAAALRDQMIKIKKSLRF